jgi:hypothetical protein
MHFGTLAMDTETQRVQGYALAPHYYDSLQLVTKQFRPWLALDVVRTHLCGELRGALYECERARVCVRHSSEPGCELFSSSSTPSDHMPRSAWLLCCTLRAQIGQGVVFGRDATREAHGRALKQLRERDYQVHPVLPAAWL